MSKILNALAVGGLLLMWIGWTAEPYARYCARNIDLSATCKGAFQVWIWLEGDFARDELRRELNIEVSQRIDGMLPERWKEVK